MPGKRNSDTTSESLLCRHDHNDQASTGNLTVGEPDAWDWRAIASGGQDSLCWNVLKHDRELADTK